MSSLATSAPQPQTPALSEGARIVNTFVAPSKTFTDLNRKASWFAPYLLLALMSLAMAFTVGQKVGWKQLNDTQLRLQPKRAAQMEQMPPEQRARAESLGVTITKVITYAIPVLLIVFCVVIAAVLLFSFNFMAGAQVKFGAALAVVFYASLPELIRSALAIVFLYAGVIAPDTFIPQNPIGSNLGVLATPGSGAYALLSSVDVFKIWVMVLTAIGFTCISKTKKGTALGIVFGWYIVVTLIQAGFAAMMS